MSSSSTVRRLLAALCATAAGGVVLLAPQAAVAAPTPSLAAPADAPGSIVQGLEFSGDAGFAYAACSGWDGGAPPSALVRDLPDNPNPGGSRSTGFTTSAGTGAGPQTAVPSLKDLGAFDVGVWSARGVSGFAYAWLFPTRGANAGKAFLGLAGQSAGGGWSTSDASDDTFTWTERDAETFGPVAGSTLGGALTPAQAARRFGNGPARVGFAFGCGGEDFSLDNFRAGTQQYDFEGISVATSMTRLRDADGSFTLVGRSAGAGRNTGEPLVLQASERGRAFRNVTGARLTVDRQGVHRAVVTPKVDTRYRWRRLEVSYADGGFSRSVDVPGTRRDQRAEKPGKGDGRRGASPSRPEPSAPPTDEPTAPGTEEPTQPTEPAVPDPTEPPTELPTDPGTPDPTQPPTEEPSAEPTPEPSPEPSPEPTAPAAPVACEGLTYDDTAVWLEAQGLTAGDITSPTDEDCPTAGDLDAMAAELGIRLELVPGTLG